MHTHKCTYMHVHTHTNTHMHAHTCMHTYTCTRMHMHAHIHVHAHVRACMHHIHIYTHACTYIHIPAYTYTHAHKHTCTCLHSHTGYEHSIEKIPCWKRPMSFPGKTGDSLKRALKLRKPISSAAAFASWACPQGDYGKNVPGWYRGQVTGEAAAGGEPGQWPVWIPLVWIPSGTGSVLVAAPQRAKRGCL